MKKFSVDTFVLNKHTLGRVVGFTEDDYIILENIRIGRWIADQNCCELYEHQSNEWLPVTTYEVDGTVTVKKHYIVKENNK